MSDDSKYLNTALPEGLEFYLLILISNRSIEYKGSYGQLSDAEKAQKK